MTKNTHVTKDGRVAKKGLWYNIHQKKKRGEKMRAKGAKGAPTAKAIKQSQKTSKKV
jgi:hypothetical protein